MCAYRCKPTPLVTETAVAIECFLDETSPHSTKLASPCDIGFASCQHIEQELDGDFARRNQLPLQKQKWTMKERAIWVDHRERLHCEFFVSCHQAHPFRTERLVSSLVASNRVVVGQRRTPGKAGSVRRGRVTGWLVALVGGRATNANPHSIDFGDSPSMLGSMR